jgi:hypothetical protein
VVTTGGAGVWGVITTSGDISMIPPHSWHLASLPMALARVSSFAPHREQDTVMASLGASPAMKPL